MPEGNSPETRSQRSPPAASGGAAGTISVLCAECGAAITPTQLDAHLRETHRIYQFRGVRRSADDTMAATLLALCAPRPDPGAWSGLSAIARQQYGERADSFLAAALAQTLARIDARQRDATLAGMAEAIGAGNPAPHLVALLAEDAAVHSRQLALALAPHLPAPLDDGTLAALRGLLADRRLPADDQMTLATSLIRTTGTEGAAALEVFKAFVNGLGKTKSIDRLRDLEGQVGASPALNDLCGQLEDLQRMNCPRCGVQMRRRAMVKHLWQEHRLVLDGRRVRDPWSMVEEWLDDYRRQPDAELLDRCRTLAQRADPEDGPRRFQRLALAHGLEEREALATFLEEAAEQQSSLCPHCYAIVPVPPEVPALPVNVWQGRVSLHGYRVEAGHRGLFSRLEIETPARRIYRGFEPGRRLTYKGALVFFATPFVLLALLIACGIVAPTLPPLLPVVLLLLGALVVAIGVRLHWRRRVPVTERALTYAWTQLVPRLHADGFSREDSAFVAGLALTCSRRQQAARAVTARGAVLGKVLSLTEKAVAAGTGVAEHLADVRRLAIVEAVAGGKEPLAQIVNQVGRCFEGRLPLVYAERLLQDWRGAWWTPANLARLRILLCDQAFEAGFEVRNLIEAGRAAPTLAELLDTKDRNALACLRLLWSLRARTPWEERCGEARTVFEVAEDREGGRLLETCPDLLLWQAIPVPAADEENTPPEAPVMICSRGVIFRDTLFPEIPQTMEVSRRQNGYELVLGTASFIFRKDPETVARRLERWMRFTFNEFLPQVPAVYDWRSPSVAATLRAHETVACPECGVPVITRLGKVGVAFEDAER